MDLTLDGQLWMTVGGANFGGPGRVALLEQIAATGSITQAAKAMKMSYKAAWDAIDTMNNLAGTPLVLRAAGGKGGGGTRLTEKGEQLVAQFKRVHALHRAFVDQLNQLDPEGLSDLALMRRLTLKISARNQLFGRVAQVLDGAVNSEVELELPGDGTAPPLRIAAIVPRDSVAELGLAPGVEAFALIKASSVILASTLDGARLSARNQLQGKVGRVQAGAVNAEVVVELPGGLTLAAIITQASADSMALAPGQPVTALFKASSVLLGVAS
jgi:molybdate transport system regulatory protein